MVLYGFTFLWFFSVMVWAITLPEAEKLRPSLYWCAFVSFGMAVWSFSV